MNLHLESIVAMLHRGDMTMDHVVAYVVKVVGDKGSSADFFGLPEDVRTKVMERLFRFRESEQWYVASNLGIENYSDYARKLLAKLHDSQTESARGDSRNVRTSLMKPLQELLERRREIDVEIAKIRATERRAALAAVAELMDAHGLTVADLAIKPTPGRSVLSRGKQTGPKYRDPQSGATWAGRGQRPNWLKEELSKGRALADFSIKGTH